MRISFYAIIIKLYLIITHNNIISYVLVKSIEKVWISIKNASVKLLSLDKEADETLFIALFGCSIKQRNNENFYKK